MAAHNKAPCNRLADAVGHEAAVGAVRAMLLAFWLAASLGTTACLGAVAQKQAGKTDPRVQPTRPSASCVWSSVIVKTNGELSIDQQAQLHSLGADVYRHLPLIHSLALRLPSRNLARLSALPFVAHVSSDDSVAKTDDFTDDSSLANVAFQDYALTGAGVSVAVLDTGIHFCNDLSKTTQGGPARILANTLFGDTCTDDFCGHGTHVAGIIAGNGAASTGKQYKRTFTGIAPQANLINVKVLNTQGQGTVSNVIAGVQWVVANKSKYNIRVINLSLGHPVGESYTTDPLCQAVEAAWKAGIVVVCAAGNDGRANSTNAPGADNEGWGTAYGSIQSPGNDPFVITVGATKSMDGNRADDKIATYSSRGPTRLDLVMKPDLVAPGNQVISLNTNNSWLAQNYGSTNLIPQSYYQVNGNAQASHDYFCLSGTSMATPVVSGAVALMLQDNPSLTPDTIKARLMISADKWTQPDGTADACTFGAGYLDIPAAINCAVVTTQPATSPPLSEDSSGNVYISRVLWGTRVIWGTSITDLRVIWGTRVIWGSSDNLLSASRVIWGSSVWSDRVLWGTSTSAVDLSQTAIYGE